MTDTDLRKTPLHALHVELGAKMVPFSGYDMPVQYPAGILKEHLHTREKAGLFDVSHMGQAFLSGADPAKALERVTPADVVGLKPGMQRYGLLLNDAGTIKDDFMFTRLEGEAEVLPIGLGARDSLRLEAGLCLYGHDIDETTGPAEANLVWAIGKRRKMDKDFIAADIVMDGVLNGTKRKRIGILPDGKAPAREHTPIADKSGRVIGEITSGGFGPTRNGPVAMGYVETEFAGDGTEIDLIVRGKAMPARVAPMPFVPHRYKRAS